MKTTIITLISLILSFGLISCSGHGAKQDPEQSEKTSRWSKPHGVLEGCDGVMSNSEQCQNNPNNKQYMIQIDRVGGE